MSELKKIVTLTLAITPSGALSPGPLSAMAVTAGLTLGALGGILLAVGHMLAELPYVAFLYFSVDKAKKYLEKAKVPMNVTVSVFLLYFSYLLLQTAMQENPLATASRQTTLGPLGAIIAGAALTGLNPYFLMWWVTVGYPIVNEASETGHKGLAAMYGSHVWMDYAWLAILAAAGGVAGGTSILAYKGLMAGLAAVLLFFAVKTLLDTFKKK